MRAFVVLSFIAVASAQSGYNYQQGVSGTRELAGSGSGINSIFSSGGSSLRGGSGLGFGSLGGGSPGGGSLGGGSLGGGSLGGSFGGGSLGGGSLGGGLGGGSSYGGGSSNQVVDGGLTKEFYLFAAPEEQAQQGQTRESVTTQIKKNLRVIFIKAPENNAVHNTALNLVKQATEDKTAIYVLTKEADVKEIAHQVEQINENVRAKPEVRFIKYRTPQDALNAQRQIQQQYEQLGGTSQSSDEGIAPVLNFASPAEHPSGAHSVNYGGGNLFASGSLGGSGSGSLNLGSLGSGSSLSGSVSSSGRDYLPPAVKK